MMLREVAELLLSVGAYDSIKLDGGGLATLGARDSDRQPHLLSRPSHTKIPGRQ